MVKSYRDLLVWQKSRELVSLVYKLTGDFPKEEKYSIVQQIQRAAISVPANIAEGSSKRSTKEYIRFLNISYGSLCELETLFYLAADLRYISENDLEIILERCGEIGRMTNGLMNKLQEKVYADA